MADEKKSFVLYCDYREHLALLSDSECGQLFKAIFDYQIDGSIPSLPPIAQMAFSFIKTQLDKDAEKYAATVRQRSEAGKKSAAAKKQNQQAGTGDNEPQQTATHANESSDGKEPLANENERQQTVTTVNEVQRDATNINENQRTSTDGNELQQAATNSTDNDNVNDNDNVFDNVIPPPPLKGGVGGNQNGIYDDRFKKFWAVYPKKIGKDAALKAFKKRKPSEELLEKMIAAVEVQKRSVQWNRDSGQYIPNPATWLNQGRWEDELPEQPQGVSSPSLYPRQQSPQQGSRNPFINAVLEGGNGNEH